jgi:DNA-3-methyladenine glycosylase II
LRGCSFSAAKAATIQSAAADIVPAPVAADQMDNEALITRPVSIKGGVGRRTVEMLLMYSLERMDVLPADDFGVREGLQAAEIPPGTYLWRMPRRRGPRPLIANGDGADPV